MLNSLMQRLNLANMKQLLKGMQKPKPPKKGPVKGSDEYPYPFHSIQSNPLTKKAPIPPQKRPTGLLTPDFDRPLFIESPRDEDPLYYHQLSHTGEEDSPISPQPHPSPTSKPTVEGGPRSNPTPSMTFHHCTMQLSPCK